MQACQPHFTLLIYTRQAPSLAVRSRTQYQYHWVCFFNGPVRFFSSSASTYPTYNKASPYRPSSCITTFLLISVIFLILVACVAVPLPILLAASPPDCHNFISRTFTIPPATQATFWEHQPHPVEEMPSPYLEYIARKALERCMLSHSEFPVETNVTFKF